MERRVLLAITLSFLVLFLFQRFVMPPSAPPASQSGATGDKPPVPSSVPGNASGLSVQSPATVPSASAPPVAQSGASAGQAPVAPEVTVGETSEREIVVETTTVRAVFTNRGARLLHWTLKAFRSDQGVPLDLVPEGAGPDAVKPFSLVVDDPAVSARLNNAIYRVSSGGTGGDKPGAKVDATATPQSVVFEMAGADGLTVKKTFSVEPGGYLIAFSTVVQLGQARLNPTIHWGPGLGDDIARSPPASFFSPSYNTPSQPIVYKDGSVERIAPTDSGSQEGAFRYAGIDDHYFLAAVINEPPAPLRIDYAPVHVPQANDPAIIGKYTAYAVKYQSPQDQTRIFFGPKTFDDLKAVDTELTRAINYGIFAWLAVPLLGALKWVYGFIGNWGWSIVVLTILINLAMFPLRHKSVVSMRKMQEIQPQMKAIQDRYAKYKVTDPERQKMNTEVMALYKARGVNPASGCVPMLLTMPFLFAFYSMLSQSIEIRGAHFAGWITNLSAPDPYFISPLVMGATMFLQQRMTPATMDPAQAKIMMFMPVMFTFMSLSFPSGLVIYWTVSNIWGIGQQYFTNYLIGSPAKPAAK
ncbi:MAG: membrane protein insertase YidC [Acidobacteriota bacterium]|nr:membrane protein insertase YidC [Acidobacteriota bacterium]